MYFALGLQNASNILFLTRTDFTLVEHVLGVREALERERVRLVVLDDDFWRGGGSQDHLDPLRTYVRTHYALVKMFAKTGDQVWERLPAT